MISRWSGRSIVSIVVLRLRKLAICEFVCLTVEWSHCRVRCWTSSVEVGMMQVRCLISGMTSLRSTSKMERTHGEAKKMIGPKSNVAVRPFYIKKCFHVCCGPCSVTMLQSSLRMERSDGLCYFLIDGISNQQTVIGSQIQLKSRVLQGWSIFVNDSFCNVPAVIIYHCAMKRNRDLIELKAWRLPRDCCSVYVICITRELEIRKILMNQNRICVSRIYARLSANLASSLLSRNSATTSRRIETINYCNITVKNKLLSWSEFGWLYCLEEAAHSKFLCKIFCAILIVIYFRTSPTFRVRSQWTEDYRKSKHYILLILLMSPLCASPYSSRPE